MHTNNTTQNATPTASSYFFNQNDQNLDSDKITNPHKMSSNPSSLLNDIKSRRIRGNSPTKSDKPITRAEKSELLPQDSDFSYLFQPKQHIPSITSTISHINTFIQSIPPPIPLDTPVLVQNFNVLNNFGQISQQNNQTSQNSPPNHAEITPQLTQDAPYIESSVRDELHRVIVPLRAQFLKFFFRVVSVFGQFQHSRIPQ